MTQVEKGFDSQFNFPTCEIFNMAIGEIVVMTVTRSARAIKHIQECVALGLCIFCKARKMLKRGYCRHCGYEFDKTMNKLPSNVKREKVKAKLAEDGKYLYPQEIREFKTPTEFARVASEV
jgi:predicted Zn-ribbon and HTH transcriptional regulator